MSITKAELERLKAQSRQYRPHIQPTPSAVIVQQVDWQIEKQRRAEIERQELRLEQTGDVLYHNFTFKSTKGSVSASFNQKTAPFGGQTKEVKTMSEQNTPAKKAEKGNPPDQHAYRVTGQGKDAHWEEVGAFWQGKDGYMTGTVNGERVVLQSNEAKEALKQVRAQKASKQAQKQTQSQGKSPSM